MFHFVIGKAGRFGQDGLTAGASARLQQRGLLAQAHTEEGDMFKAIVGVIGLSVVLPMIGCAASEPRDTEEVAETQSALYYSHPWGVYSLENGVRHDYYAPNDIAELNGLGFGCRSSIAA